MPPASRPRLALLLTLTAVACFQPEDPRAVSGVAKPLAEFPADQRSLWTTAEGRTIYYYIDVDRQVSSVSPAQSSCAKATPGTRGDEELPPGIVATIPEALKRYEEQTPLRFVRLESLPFDRSGNLIDPGYDILVFTRWDLEGVTHGAPAPPEGEVLSCIYFPPAPNTTQRTVQHEVGHNLGMTHEQNRSDRDDWIVTSDLACAGAEGKFDDSRNLTPYDYTTIMHYRSKKAAGCPEYDYLKNNCHNLTDFACCTNADATCGCPRGDECRLVGAGEDFSLEDINALYEAYPPKLDDLGEDHRYGAAMASGDFDGDGYQDLAIGAPGAARRRMTIRQGLVFVYKGTYLGLVPWKTLAQDAGGEDDDEFGAALASGDIDGDGVDDLVVGAPGKRSSGVRSGGIFLFQGIQVVSGGDGGTPVAGGLTLKASVHQSSFSGYADHEGDRFGAAVEIAQVQAGDQVLVGAPGTSKKAGSVYILTWNAATPALALSRRLANRAVGSEFGTDVRAGQLDAPGSDSYDDIVVGAPGASPSGKIFLYKGASTGVTPAGSIEAEEAGIIMPKGSSARFGTALRMGRFHDENGKMQIAVGAPSAGRVTVLQVTLTPPAVTIDNAQLLFVEGSLQFGQTLAAGDVNADGVSDLAVGAPGNASGTAYVYRGVKGADLALVYWNSVTEPSGHGQPATGDQFGGALEIANFNNDDYDDLAIGVPGADRGGFTDAGASYFMVGSSEFPPLFSSDEFRFTTYLQADSYDDVQKK